MTLHRLNCRIARLEQEQEAEDRTGPQVIIRFGDEGDPLPPGTRVLHIELNGPAWWEVIGEGDDV